MIDFFVNTTHLKQNRLTLDGLGQLSEEHGD
jgi:hypothetical protein